MSAQLQQTWAAGAPAPPRDAAYQLARLAVGALHAELACAPKPGLVTPFDSGSHTDMDAATFMRSLFALRGYFVAIAQAGIDHAPFERLRDLGIGPSPRCCAPPVASIRIAARFSALACSLRRLHACGLRSGGDPLQNRSAMAYAPGAMHCRLHRWIRTATANGCVRSTASVACANTPRQGIRCCARSPCLRCVLRLRGRHA